MRNKLETRKNGQRAFQLAGRAPQFQRSASNTRQGALQWRANFGPEALATQLPISLAAKRLRGP